jgi:hypothetical protein
MASQPASSAQNLSRMIWDWCQGHPRRVLTLLTVVLLAPFLAKPFNIDDPLFIWTAQQLHAHPGNPYGFNLNWYGFSQPMWQVTQNPPLMSYYLAAAGGILGWSEAGMHFACLLPAVAAILGTCRLAKSLCRWPLFAALATLFAPVFLVSGTTVMCDVSLLAFWVWAAVFWTEGLRQNDPWKLAAAGTLAALALLTKYNGVSLIPLLAASGWLEKRAVGCWAVFLLIPVAAFFAYEWLTGHLYGQGLFFAAAHYAQAAQGSGGISKLAAGLLGLTFTGGCFAGALFCAPFLWNRRALAWIVTCAGLFMALALAGGMMAKNFGWLTGTVRSGVEAQMFFWAAGGACVLALAVADVRQNRDAGSWLLALWVLGTFAFAAFFNWTVNGRAVLPMAPAVAILLARRLELSRPALPAGITFSLAACAALGLLAATADFQLAGNARKCADRVKAAAGSKRVWFQGHWGFQYYMQACGFLPLDANGSTVAVGDILIIPVENSNTGPPDANETTLVGVFNLPAYPWLVTFNHDIGAGFYSSLLGPLPFAFGRMPPEHTMAYAFKPPAMNPQ